MASLKLKSFNVRQLADGIKRRQMFNYLRDKQADVILLQETHSTTKMEKVWRNEWGGNIYYSHGNSNARGVCILFKPRAKYKIKGKTIDEAGRFIFN